MIQTTRQRESSFKILCNKGFFKILNVKSDRNEFYDYFTGDGF